MTMPVMTGLSILNLLFIIGFMGLTIYIFILVIQLLKKTNKLVDKKLTLIEKEEAKASIPVQENEMPLE